jgi:hypothetical protein
MGGIALMMSLLLAVSIALKSSSGVTVLKPS